MELSEKIIFYLVQERGFLQAYGLQQQQEQLMFG